ncbi:type II secretion system F family protein [Planctomycetota bacterium]|nr:type II secretion system F family protein [Planctomycetota bacterium]QQE12588.1 type II secretion system F family protein [Planctomycetota bacterium]
MAVYSYKASHGGSGVIDGTVVADSARAARDQLREKGLVVQELTADQNTKKSGLAGLSIGPRIRPIQMVEFVRELSTLLGVGTPLLEALDTIIKQQRGEMKSMLLRIRERVAAGMSLHEALKEARNTGGGGSIDGITVSMVAVGEDAGNLDEVLDELASYKEHSAALKNRVLSALLYPSLVLCVGVLVSIFLMTYVVPGLIDSLEEAGRELPMITKVVKAVSDFILYQWWVLVGGAMLMIGGGVLVMRSYVGRHWVHRMILKVPILGDLVRKQTVVQLSFVIATLMRSGIPFEQAIRLARSSVGNMLLRDALEETEEAVREGSEIAEALEKTGAFSATVVQVFALGQQSGKLEKMLTRLGRDYDRQVATTATRFATVLEPIMIVLLAVMIGMIAFATILPILEMGNTL